jgi:glycosyltransferase involved in cell wall biosynthesis
VVFESEEVAGLAGVVGLVPFPIWPTHFGGAERCWNVLSRLGPIKVRALSWEARFEEWTRGDVDYVVSSVSPAASTHAERLQEWGFRTYDAAPSMAKQYLTDFADAVKADQPDLVILEHPWLVDFVPEGVPYVYDSHNAEAYHHGERWGYAGPEFENIFDLERRAVQGAELVTACSLSDVEIMREMFGDFPVMHVPNGVTTPDLTGRKPTQTLLFIGSQYPPNIDAANRLSALARVLPEFQIVIAGGCSYFVQSDATNVQLLGMVNDQKLHELFLQAGLFVNLMTSGSGTHLKVGRALSYGVPVVTTEIGKRGYETPMIATLGNAVGKIEEAWGDYDRLSSEALREASSLSWDSVVEPLRNWVETRG